MTGKRTLLITLYIALSALLLSGCDNRRAVPQELADKAVIPGMPGIRSFGDSVDPVMASSLLDAITKEDPSYFPTAPDGTKTYYMLAISGGADNGAYGVGILKGWSATGSRPVLKGVTGVSTGALIAPYAFLGSAYDDEIKNIYTSISTKDIMKRKSLLISIFGNSLMSSEPLAKLISRCASKEILSAIAREHKRGRRLFVGTANIDAQNLTIWDMGAIAVMASSGDEKAAELFRKVLLASASIPVTFPPVFFDVEAGGQMYREMHVDGGTITQVFYTYGLAHNLRKAARKMGFDKTKVKVTLYVIRNGRVSPDYKQVRDWIGPIAERAIDTVSEAQAVGDLYRLYAIAMEKGNAFNVAYIPDDHVTDKNEIFDPQEMKRLFQRGYEDALNGRAWHDTPPGWDKILMKEEE